MSILLTRWRNISPFYTTFVLMIQKRFQFEPAPLFAAMPLNVCVLYRRGLVVWLSICLKTNTPSCIPKKTLKLCIYVWTPVTWPQTLESTLPFNIPFRNSWETTQLSTVFCDDASLTDQQFGHNIASPKFPAALSFLNLIEALSFFGKHLIFFPMILKTYSIWLL